MEKTLKTVISSVIEETVSKLADGQLLKKEDLISAATERCELSGIPTDDPMLQAIVEVAAQSAIDIEADVSQVIDQMVDIALNNLQQRPDGMKDNCFRP